MKTGPRSEFLRPLLYVSVKLGLVMGFFGPSAAHRLTTEEGTFPKTSETRATMPSEVSPRVSQWPS